MPVNMTGSVLLSFDDRFTRQWVQAIPLFADHAARVTFFVDRFHELSQNQLEDLNCLAAAGHEIGCHGLTHAYAPDLLASLGADGFLASEIDPAIERMKSHGFVPRSYAYPFSRRTDQTDAALWRRFACLRTGLIAPTEAVASSLDTCFVPRHERSNHRLLFAKSIDESGMNDCELERFLALAGDSGACVALYAHGIAEASEHHHITPRRLERLLITGKRNGLDFQCFSDQVA